MYNKFKQLLFTSTSKDTIATMVGNAGIAIAGMLFTIIAARSLTTENFGVLSALLALFTLLASLGELGIPSALINFLPKFQNERHVLISLTFWFQLITSFVFALVVLALISFKETLIPGATTPHLIIVSALVFVGVLEGFTQAVLRAERHFILASILWIVDSFVKLILLFGVFILRQVTIEDALLVTLASASFATLIALSKEFKNIQLTFPRHHFKQIYLFTRWIALTRVFSVTISRVDVILLNSLANGYEAGIFAVASRISLVFAIIASSIGNVVAPRFSSFTTKEQISRYMKKLTLLVGVTSLAMLLTIVLAKPFISLVFGAKYMDAVPVFQLMTLSMIPFLFTIVTVNPIIYSYNKPNFIAFITFIQTLILITLDVLLIPIYGAFAPTIAMAISNIIVLFFTGWKLRKLLV